MGKRIAVLVGVIVLIFCVSPRAAQAKELYVDGGNSSCSDSTSYAANDADHPWCGFLRATWGNTNRSGACTPGEAAQAGDTVHVSGGPYSAPGQDSRLYAAFMPCNDGTPNARIVFEGVTRVTLQTSSGTGPVIGGQVQRGGSYTTWRNFKIDQAVSDPYVDSGAAAVWGLNGVTFDNLEIIGVQAPAWQNNHSAIRLENGAGHVVRNCDLSNFTEIGYEGTGITTYNAYDLLIEHNEIHGNGFGVHLKQFIMRPDGVTPLDGSENYEITVRFNKFYNNISAELNLMRLTGPSVTTHVYQNVFYATGSSSLRAVRFHGYTGGVPAHVSIVNNTIYGAYPGGGFYLSGGEHHTSNLVQNNIVADTPYYVFAPDVCTAGGVGSARVDFQYNLTNSATVAQTCSTTWSWNSWTTSTDSTKTTVLDDTGSSYGVDPRFVDSAGLDFRLCRGAGVPTAGCSAASPAIGAGRDILDLDNDGSTTDTITLGAYITGDEVIGLGGTGGEDPGVPPGVVSGLERSDVLPPGN